MNSKETLVWEDAVNSGSDWVAACIKGGRVLFQIKEAKFCYYADYDDNSLFKTATLPYYKAAQMAEEKFGSVTVENRLEVAKEYFLEDYKEQVFKKMMELQSLSI